MGSAVETRYMTTMTNDTDREAKFRDTAKRVEQATKDLAAEGRFGGPDRDSSEIEMMDEAAELVRAAKKPPGWCPRGVGVSPLDGGCPNTRPVDGSQCRRQRCRQLAGCQ